MIRLPSHFIRFTATWCGEVATFFAQFKTHLIIWLCWCSQSFKFREPLDRKDTVIAAHIERRLQAGAAGRAFCLAEDRAAQIGSELYTGHTRGFALGHAGNGAGDGRCDATGCTQGPAVKRLVHARILPECVLLKNLPSHYRHQLLARYSASSMDRIAMQATTVRFR